MRTHISNKFLGDAVTAVPGTTLNIVPKVDWMPSSTVRKHHTFSQAAPKTFNQTQTPMIESQHLKQYLIIIGWSF